MLSEIPKTTIDAMLDAYASKARYLRNASLDYPRAEGRFEVASCAYSGDGKTWGHLTAVEFLLCYNQLAYVAAAESLRLGALPGLASMPVQEFTKIQAERSFIARIAQARFLEPVPLGAFSGEMTILRACVRAEKLYLFSEGSFCDGRMRASVSFVADFG